MNKQGFKVDIFVAGFPKTGTTSLFDYLASHDRIEGADVKEPHFFAPDIEWYRSKRVSRLSDYAALFSDKNLLKMEASTWYLYSNSAIPKILHRFPDAKFIVGLRRPSDAAKSLAIHRLFAGKEVRRFVEEAVNSSYFFKKYAHYYDYEKLLARFLTHVDRKNVFFYFFEDLQEQDVYRDLFGFLEVDQMPVQIRSEIKNPSKKNRSPTLQTIVSLIPMPFKRMVRNLLGERRVARLWEYSSSSLPKIRVADENFSSDEWLALDKCSESYLRKENIWRDAPPWSS